MEPTDSQRALLREVLLFFLKQRRWPSTHAFKMDHLAQRQDIKQLGDIRALRIGPDFIELTLYGLLECHTPESESEISDCGSLWPTLREAYSSDPNHIWTVEEIASRHAMRTGQANATDIARSLTFLDYLYKPQPIQAQHFGTDRLVQAIRVTEDVFDVDEANWKQLFWNQHYDREKTEEKAREAFAEGEQVVERRAAIRRLGIEGLHPDILKASNALFTDGHYPEAILAAFKAIEVRVRAMSALEGQGEGLMSKAFGGDSPKINVAIEQGQSGKDEQHGFTLLFMGAMSGIRNPKAHGFVKQDDPAKALEYLAFASLLMRRLDDAKTAAHVEAATP